MPSPKLEIKKIHKTEIIGWLWEHPCELKLLINVKPSQETNEVIDRFKINFYRNGYSVQADSNTYNELTIADATPQDTIVASVLVFIKPTETTGAVQIPAEITLSGICFDGGALTKEEDALVLQPGQHGRIDFIIDLD